MNKQILHSNERKPTISLIAAIGKNRELGRGNKLLFDIPEDMKFFREKTKGHPVIMGRKTFESIGRPLPGRTNIVITRDFLKFKDEHPEYWLENVNILAQNMVDAIKFAKQRDKEEIFIIGGAQIYKLALPYADKLYLTLVDTDVPDADAFFPDYSEFKKVSERKSSDENYKYSFAEFVR